MGEWNIYDSSSQVKATVKRLEYNGEFMGERSVTATLYSPSPINLAVGDYLTYRNEVFSIDYDPSILKQARNNTYGQGYVYDSVKFNSRQMELVYCKFLDYVIADNQVHYSSLPNFSFYCETITNLTERIQANLNRLYTGGKAWTITVNAQNVHVGRINIDVQGMTCWDALGLISEKFESTFVIRGRNIVVAPSTDILTGLFQYGKGNGLRSIARTSDPSQGVVTRLRAMGNTTNMPYNYYRNKDMYVYAPITEVLGPYEASADIHTTFDFNNCFTVKAATSADNQYRTKVSLDKVNWATALFSANAAWVGYSVASVLQLSGYDPVQYAAFMQQLNTGTYTKLYFESGISKDKWPSSYKEYTGTLGVTTGEDRLMLPTYPDVTTDPYIDSANISKYGVREESVIFDGSNGLDDIFPTIQGMTAEQARAAGATISLDSGDNGHLDEIVSATQIDDDGIPPVEGEESEMVETFSITLKDIGFNINDYFATDNAVISMRDGKCEGREFEITECVKSGNKYVLTCRRELDDSLNRYFPYDDYNLTSGDKFVLLQIEMPELYVDAASQRLEDAAEAYLATIDHSIYTIEPKIDNIKAKRHDDEVESAGEGVKVYDTIYEGMLMQIEDEDLDIDDAIFIDRLTIKEGDSLIPQYEVVLRNEKVKTSIQQIQQQITDIKSGVAGVSGNGTVDANQLNQLIKNYGDNRFLRKDIIDKLKSGVQLGDTFVSGLLGNGSIWRKNVDGKTYLEADELYIRAKAYFDTLEVRELTHTGGNRVASAAGIKCIKVEYINSSGEVTTDLASAYKFRCYFRMSDSDNNPIQMNFQVGDLARCQEFNLQGGLRSYWRKVVATSGSNPDSDGLGYIDLSNVGGEYSLTENAVPKAQDDIVQLGNVNQTSRQGAIIEYSSGGGNVPSYQIYQGINTFSLENCNYVDLGYNPSTGRAYMKIYGDFYVGDSSENTYVKYTQGVTPKLEIKAVISAQSPIADGNTNYTLEQYIQAHQTQGWTQSQLETLIYNETYQEFSDLESAISNIQDQIDGNITVWYGTGTPTLNNYPAEDWDDYSEHEGDLYYDTNTYNAYRFVYDSGTGNYSWQVVTDSAVTEALALALEARDLADGKRRIFVTQPTPPYDIGDMWVYATYPYGSTYTDAANNRYYRDILRCKTQKGSTGSFNITDWTLASKYTDDSYVTNWITSTYTPMISTIQAQVDGKAETWYQNTNPESNWTTDADKLKHVGDLWYCTEDIGSTQYKQGTTWYYTDNGVGTNPRFEWVFQNVPQEVFDTIDGKADIFVSRPTTYNANDMWIIESGLSSTYMPTGCVSGDIVISSTKRTNNYQKADWSKKDRYTDDTSLNGFLAQIISGTGAPSGSNAETAGTALNAVTASLEKGNSTDTIGGLILTSLIAMRDNSTSNTVWSGISGHYEAQETGQDWKGHGIAAWYGGKMKDKEVSAYASDSEAAKSLFRFDGSGYVANGNITWNAQGAVTIKNITTLYDSQDSNILNELTRFNNAFTFATSGQDSTTVLSITPNVPFTRLKILENGNGNDVATQAWVTSQLGNYVTAAFFSRLFQALDSSDSTIAVNASTEIASIQAMKRLWTEYDISALGNGGSGGSGGGASTLNELDDVTISGTPTNGQVLTYQNGYWVNGEGGGSGASSWSQITGKPTTISEYGITDAYISSGTITLGSNSLTPVTTTGNQTISGVKTFTGDLISRYFSFSATQYLELNNGVLTWVNGNTSSPLLTSASLSGYATQSWVQSQGYVTSDTKNTAGTTNKTGTKMYLVAATSQGANPQTYSNSNCYIGTDNCLYSGGTKVLTSHQSLSGYATESWVNTQLGNYVTLGTTQTITGGKTFSATVRLSGVGIEDVGGAGLLVYRPSGSWTAISSTQWGAGSVDSQGVIRSSNSDLIHYRKRSSSYTSNDDFPVLDTYNVGEFSFGIFPYDGTAITSNTDLNNYLNAGTYHCDSGSIATTLSNKPYSGGNFRMWNIYNTGTNGSSSESWFAQMILAVNEGDIYIRGHYDSTFTSWARVMKSNGGTFTGDITVQKGGTSDTDVRVTNSNGSIALNISTNRGIWDYTTSRWLITTNGTQTWLNGGNVGIGNYLGSTVSEKLTVDGNILATGDITALSDIRQKSPISDVNTRIDDIATLPLFYFKWKYKDDDNMHIGTSAQAVQKLFPELVLGGEELSVNYGVLGTTLGILNSRKLTEHEQRINDLENENKRLRERIMILEDRA